MSSKAKRRIRSPAVTDRILRFVTMTVGTHDATRVSRAESRGGTGGYP